MAKEVPWRDKRVRQAVSKTIDRQVIIDNVYAGVRGAERSDSTGVRRLAALAG